MPGGGQHAGQPGDDGATGQRLEVSSFTALPGWTMDNHAAALAAFQLSAREYLRRPNLAKPTRLPEWEAICRTALQTGPEEARHFFETHFVPHTVVDGECPEGLFTGYFEPEVQGSLAPSEACPVPVYARPDDLVAFDEQEAQQTGLAYGRRTGQGPAPYDDRKTIEQGSLAGRGLELCWLSSWADLFFMQVQGSGRVRLANGNVLRLTYAAKTGLPYTSIGKLLVEQGTLTADVVSMQSIRSWMDLHPDEARALMWANRSFVFFRRLEDANPALGAVGAGKVQLTPLRSLAVDRSLWQCGTPMWLSTRMPQETGGETWNRLMVAQDTGTAIRGALRGDIYFGWGHEAALRAGHMKSTGQLWALLPRAQAMLP